MPEKWTHEQECGKWALKHNATFIIKVMPIACPWLLRLQFCSVGSEIEHSGLACHLPQVALSMLIDWTLDMSDSNRLSVSSSTPSFVDRVDLTTIASLAEAAHKQSSTIDALCTVTPVPKVGAFNVVWFLDFSNGAQWVLRTPIAEWRPSLKKRMESDIVATRLIQNSTIIPIPRIHDFSVIPKNALGRPYMLMERVKGKQLCTLWFDPTWFTEERRRTVFDSLVFYMSQLQVLTFPSIGSLDYDPKLDSHFVIPFVPFYDGFDESGSENTTSGPYNTVHAYLIDQITSQMGSASSINDKVRLALLRMFVGLLLDETLDGPPFVLSMPDFNYQNVFVDDDGNVTSLIDWDNTMVGPRQGGYAKYPSWITRDWDPSMYGYPQCQARPSVEGEVSDQNEESSGIPASPAIEPVQNLRNMSLGRKPSMATLFHLGFWKKVLLWVIGWGSRSRWKCLLCTT